MTKIEYIRATNRVKVSMAYKILSDVQPGDDYGITNDELREITSPLSYAERRLWESYECKEG